MFRILVAVGVLAGVITALYPVTSWALARLWCNPKRLPVTRTPADLGLGFEAILFPSRGVPLRGWFIPAESTRAAKPVIVLVHGWRRNAMEWLPLVRILRRAGFGLLLFDARGHGASGADGPITILKLAEDVIAAIDYLLTRTDVDQSRLGVLGRSFGGAGAILAASRDPRIRAIVSCSAFADPKALTRDFLASFHVPGRIFAIPVFRFIERWLGTSMDSVAPQNNVGRIAAPLLLIHGAADRFIKPDDMETLYARAPRELTQRLLVPGRGHSDVIRDLRSRQAIVAFFCRVLLPDLLPTALAAPVVMATETEPIRA